MKTTRSMGWILAFLVVPAAPGLLGAQARGPLRPGDEIRVSWYDGGWGTQVGAYSAVRSQTLDFVALDQSQLVGTSRERLYIIQTSSLRDVRRRIGTKPAAAPAMVAGSAAGFAAAFVIGALSSRDGGDAVNAGLSAGVLIGAPVGALVAWMSSRSRPIYEDVGIPGRR